MKFLMRQFGMWNKGKFFKATNILMLKEQSRKPSLTCATPSTMLTAGDVYKPLRETLFCFKNLGVHTFLP